MLHKQIFYLESIGFLKDLFFENESGIIKIGVLHHPSLDEISLYLPEEITMLWADALHLLKLVEEGHRVLIAFEAQFEQINKISVLAKGNSSDLHNVDKPPVGTLKKLIGAYVDGCRLNFNEY